MPPPRRPTPPPTWTILAPTRRTVIAAAISAARLSRYRLPIAAAGADIWIITLRVAKVVPVVAGIAARLTEIGFGNIIRVRINRRGVKEPPAVRPPPPAVAAVS